VDTLGIVSRVSTSFRNVAHGLGGGAAANVLGEVAEWSGVAAGCGSSIIAGSAAPGWGTAAGAMACIGMVFGKLFGYFGKSQPPPVPSAGTPMALFTPAKEQLGTIAGDAERLAALLRYFYGVPSYESIFGRITKFNTPMDYENYPPAPPPSEAAQNSPPGYDPITVLYALRIKNRAPYCGKLIGTDKLEPTARRCASNRLRYLFHLGLKDKLFDYQSPQGVARKTSGKHNVAFRWDLPIWYGDINQYYIKKLADMARGRGNMIYDDAVAKEKEVAYYSKGSPNYLSSIQKASGNFSNVWAELEPVLYFDELLNFFSAVTLYDIDKNRGIIEDYLNYRLPIALWSVSKEFLSQEKKDIRTRSQQRYRPLCWTASSRCDLPACRAELLGPKILSKDMCAIREFAMIRLLAAFSYLQMTYMWGRGDSFEKIDMIKELPDIRNPGGELEVPVSPKSQLVRRRIVFETEVWDTPSITKIYNEIKLKNSEYERIREMAIKQAEADQQGYKSVALDQETLRTLRLPPSVIADPRLLMVDPSMIKVAGEFERQCEAGSFVKNGVTYKGIVGVTRHGKNICCPSLSQKDNATICAGLPVGRRCQQDCLNPGNYPLTPWKTPRPPPSPAAGATAAVAIAGAALLAFKFFK
jgi:hypothetical protein